MATVLWRDGVDQVICRPLSMHPALGQVIGLLADGDRAWRPSSAGMPGSAGHHGYPADRELSA